MTSIIRWQEPPASAAGRKANQERVSTVEQLKLHPGKWALVAESVNGSAVGPWKKLGCEAVGRRNAKDANKADIYVRWPAPSKGKAAAYPATLPASLPAAKEPARSAAAAPASPKAKPAKASLPLSTAAPRLDPNDPKDAALLRERQRFEAARATRLNGGRNA
ncbi:hypothetical protein LJ753_11000 [Arthrobacter sp. zg-Y20]|uniref:hypothetical protein n=1 Tax=unclassified Arthrobacter TaxID=235627 RepID=UPI001D1550E7|nr:MULTISPECIES: hypothetical protein [unclassified Arthrobacter]MCC3276397.1 hypothetical protein [Arthrobacter sp. zg-Y20]MDK1316556.1 hypothetical protein [Arthrobacter sp. zg.Y20]WIB06596.1 hypothetical protein QNO06_02300 [Arthrobacter sp. zg-Y20]